MHTHMPLLVLVIVLAAAAGWLADRLQIPAYITLPLLALFLWRRRPDSTADDARANDDDLPAPESQAQPEKGQFSVAALEAPALVVSKGWQVLAANKGAEGLFSRQLVESDLRQTVRHPMVIDSVRLALEGNAPTGREINLPAAGQEAVFRLRLVPLGDQRVLVQFIDIGEARQVERARVDFVANASHELRTPLASIAGFIETLQGAAADDANARGRFLQIMGQEAWRMARLIDDLLSLSRIEMDRHLRPEQAIDLRPLLDEVGKALAPQLEADGRQLLLELPPDLSQVIADRDQILQVLHNLLTNALKYGRPGTPIRLSAENLPMPRNETMVRISVADEGEGIDADLLPRLTERFFRVDAGRSRELGGTGLGLAIVKRIVERHRGQLEIRSRKGEGTVVSLLLPVTLS